MASSQWLLLRATLAHGFGGDSLRPLRAALWRLLGFAIGALGIGVLMARGVEQIPLIPLPHAELLMGAVAVAVQLGVAFALLVASGTTKAGQQEVFAKLLLVWPLSANWRWLMFMLPNVILGILTVLMLAWPLGIIFSKLGLAWPLIIAAMMAGYASAFGLLHSPLRRIPQLVVLWLPGIVWLEYELLRRANDFALELPLRLWAAAGIAAVLVLLIVVAAGGRTSLGRYLAQRMRHQPVRLQLPPRWWFLAKLLRRTSIQMGLGVALLMSVGLAVAARRYGFNDLDALSLFVALVAASVATDVRATARRHNPAEITALHGTSRLMRAVIFSALVIGMVVALPVVVAVFDPLRNQTSTALWHLALQPTIGVLAGVLAGTLIVPQGRDISSQFVSTLLVLGILFAFPQIQAVGHLAGGQRNLVDIFLCLIIITGIFGIEFKRNPYKWRKPHAGY